VCNQGLGGFGGGKPWFYTFWGCFGVFWGLVRLANSDSFSHAIQVGNIIISQRDIIIILYIYIYLYRGGLYRGIWGIGGLLD
jgi:hypothetical protein